MSTRGRHQSGRSEGRGAGHCPVYKHGVSTHSHPHLLTLSLNDTQGSRPQRRPTARVRPAVPSHTNCRPPCTGRRWRRQCRLGRGQLLSRQGPGAGPGPQPALEVQRHARTARQRPTPRATVNTQHFLVHPTSLLRTPEFVYSRVSVRPCTRACVGPQPCPSAAALGGDAPRAQRPRRAPRGGRGLRCGLSDPPVTERAAHLHPLTPSSAE